MALGQSIPVWVVMFNIYCDKCEKQGLKPMKLTDWQTTGNQTMKPLGTEQMANEG